MTMVSLSSTTTLVDIVGVFDAHGLEPHLSQHHSGLQSRAFTLTGSNKANGKVLTWFTFEVWRGSEAILVSCLPYSPISTNEQQLK